MNSGGRLNRCDAGWLRGGADDGTTVAVEPGLYQVIRTQE
jgi:hypothetical protein